MVNFNLEIHNQIRKIKKDTYEINDISKNVKMAKVISDFIFGKTNTLVAKDDIVKLIIKCLENNETYFIVGCGITLKIDSINNLVLEILDPFMDKFNMNKNKSERLDTITSNEHNAKLVFLNSFEEQNRIGDRYLDLEKYPKYDKTRIVVLQRYLQDIEKEIQSFLKENSSLRKVR